MRRPRLALVPGEPAGVGPELAVAALRRESDADLVVFAEAATLARAARVLGTALTFHDSRADRAQLGDDGVRLVEVPNVAEAAFGSPDPRNARSVVLALRMAAEACMAGEYDGMVTGPVHKATINAGGIAYTGTTELLAAHAGCEVVMMLANPLMRVALATTHLPLRAVADALDGERLERTLRILHAALRGDFGIDDPLVAVLGLNPHAGEQGHLGREEIEVVAPVLERLRAEGMRLDGPLPADTAFLPRRLAATDAVLAMYHDQGLPVLKYSGFEQAVNLTLGLPYPRVAVDHGTALDLAGSGRADPSSMLAAVAACARIAGVRRTREQQR
ncbi:4-hydroxythreonine-4-phosphate dehydrogenase PdxA [Luteimonas sp. RD2P54]|uniref:4-hydroxythreonine-4-phosphate dehydrogenase n=1 Tax=Luteimonas endophytica TaxID=3042023 RepID=A0ABT6J5R6_9GAMM|nr:4-hydroxythreonine-4-phosphate dehydrogenase PdxA [Luteimonas endophytica]MDH5822177.1 4-hydroxythreonine-4-phosphate dehydrogenase PdxA [Luteimonas endophytica]